MSKEEQKISFEEALEELEVIVRKLETGQVKLDDAVKHYEKGVKLKKFCEDKLKNAKARIDMVSSSNESGEVKTETLDVE